MSHPTRLLALQDKLLDTDALISKLERSLTPTAKPSVRATLESLQSRRKMLEEDFYALAGRHSLDVCRYRMFNKGDRYKLTGFSKALTDFQATFSLTFDALKNGPKLKAVIPPEVDAATSFDFAYAFGGSVGVVLTLENERLLLGKTLLDEAMELVFEMARSESPDEIAAFAKRLGPPPIRALYKWASAHVSGDTGADIEWRKDENVTTLQLQRPEIERLRDAIASTSEEVIEHHTFTGTLKGIDVITKRFRFERASGEVIAGSTGDVVRDNSAVVVPSAQTVRLELKTRIHYAIDKEDKDWRLLGFVD